MPLSGFQTLKSRSIGLREGLLFTITQIGCRREYWGASWKWKGQRQNATQEWTKPSAQLRRTWGIRLNLSHWCIPGSHKDQQHIKLSQQNHCQEVKGRDYSLLLITQWTTPGVLLKAEADRAERVSTGSPGQSGPAVPALWNESGAAGLPLPGEGTALAEHNSCQSESERCLSKRQSTVLY